MHTAANPEFEVDISRALAGLGARSSDEFNEERIGDGELDGLLDVMRLAGQSEIFSPVNSL